MGDNIKNWDKIMDEKAYQRMQPQQYLSRFLDYNIRPDGRSFCELRPLSICPQVMKHFCLGSVALSAGHSRYIAGVTASIISPAAETYKQQKYISVSIEFPKSCGVLLDGGKRRAGFAPDLSMKISRILQNPEVLDPAQLSIASGAAFWFINVNVICLEYDGNPFDHSLLSAVSALETTVLPTVHWNSSLNWWQLSHSLKRSNDSNQSMFDLHQHHKRRIQFKNKPLSITLSHLLQTHWVLDATYQEELFGSDLTVYKFDKNNQQPLMFFRNGGGPLQLSSELPQLIPLIHQAFNLLEKELERAKMDLLAKDSWEICCYNETDIENSVEMIEKGLEHIELLPFLALDGTHKKLDELQSS